MFKKTISPAMCIFITLILCIATLIATLTIVTLQKHDELAQKDLEYYNSAKLKDIIEIIKNKYIGELDEETLWDTVYKAAVEALGDEYSTYISADDYALYLTDRNGSFVGVGIRVVKDENSSGALISSVIGNTPASEAGLLANDVITAVDGVTLTDDNYDTVIGTVAGEEGSEVVLTIKRGDETEDYTLTRRKIASEDIIYKKTDTDIALMSISSFGKANTDELFVSLVEQAQKDGCKGYVFDVRDNSGGALDVILKILDRIMPAGDIMTITDKAGKVTKRESDSICIEAPIAVLCNGGTASAAELFTAALSDSCDAITVGTKTFGKGVMQTYYSLPDGSTVKLSSGFFAPPSGESFNKTGITPKLIVTDENAQLQAALYAVESQL